MHQSIKLSQTIKVNSDYLLNNYCFIKSIFVIPTKNQNREDLTMHPKNKLTVFILLINLFIQPIAPSLYAISQSHNNSLNYAYNNEDETIIIDTTIADLILLMVRLSQFNSNADLLPDCLLRCYEKIVQKDYALNTSDLYASLPLLIEFINLFVDNSSKSLRPELLDMLNAYVNYNDKAPRPGISIPHENEIVGPGCCDLGTVINLLHQVLIQLNICCEQQGCPCESEFQQTWTILANLSVSCTAVVDLTPVFTALDACCSNINNEFQQTWSILGAGFNGTFSTLQDIKNTLTNCCDNFNGTYSAIADLKITLSTDFYQTWTILAAIANAGCSNTSITQADIDAAGGSFVINNPGNYSLHEDISSTGSSGSGIIRITTNNVTLDLCNRSLTGLGGNNTSGIFIDTTTNIIIKNGLIQNVNVSGIVVNGESTDIILDHITTLSCGIFGIQFGTDTANSLSNANAIVDSRIIYCASLYCGQRSVANTVGGFFAFNCFSLIIENSLFNNNEAEDVNGAYFSQVSNCVISDSCFDNNLSTTSGRSGTGLFLATCDNNYFANSTFNSNEASGPFSTGIGVRGSEVTNNIFFNCHAINNTGAFANGFHFSDGIENILENVTANQNIASAGQSNGFLISAGTASQCINCRAIGNSGTTFCAGYNFNSGTENTCQNSQSIGNTSSGITAGIVIRGESSNSVENCTIKNNSGTTSSYGIFLDGTGPLPNVNCYIRANDLSNNISAGSSWGILDNATNASTTFVGSNFAFNNGTNYDVTYVSAVLPVVSGTFGGALPATNTTGSFDNIDINP